MQRKLRNKMALVTCHECGKSVSTEAKKCPACGATVKQPKKPTSKLLWSLLAVLVVGTVVANSGKKAEADAAVKAEAARIAAMTPEQVAQAKAQKDKADGIAKAKKDKENQILTLAAAGAKTLKQSSKDPQTFEFVSITTHPNSSVCYEYRAKNSFNAMLAGDAVLADGKLLVHESAGNAFVKAWNKNCTPADGEDVTSFIKRFVEA